MLQEELLKTYADMKESLDSAPESPVPFPVVKDEKLSVIGDANETQINRHDFTITFKFPVGTVEGQTESIVRKKEFKNVFITPRKSMRVISIVCRMMPFFRKIVDDNGTSKIEKYSLEEIVGLIGEHGTVFSNDMYDLVAGVLDIDDDVVDFMEPDSVLNATAQIFREYPELINEAEAFFS